MSPKKHAEYLEESRKAAADDPARVAAGTQNSLLANLPFLSIDPKDLRPRTVQRWQRYLEECAKPEHATLGHGPNW